MRLDLRSSIHCSKRVRPCGRPLLFPYWIVKVVHARNDLHVYIQPATIHDLYKHDEVWDKDKMARHNIVSDVIG